MVPDCHSQRRARPQPVVPHSSHCCPMAGMTGAGAPSLAVGSPASACPGPDSISNYPPPITFSLLPQHSRKNTRKKKHIAGETLFCKSLPLHNRLEILRDLICLCLFCWVALAAACRDPTFDVLMILAGKILNVFVVGIPTLS